MKRRARGRAATMRGVVLAGTILWIRYYDPSGHVLTSAGGYGDGPFEFRMGASVFERLPGFHACGHRETPVRRVRT